MRAVFLILILLVALLGVAAGGLAMSPYLAARLHVAPFRVTIVKGGVVPETICRLLGEAKSEVLLASDFIDNLTILQAAETAARRGTVVTVVLPIKDRNQNAFRWLSEHRITLRTAKTPFRGSALIVDRLFVAESASPLLSKGDFAKEQVALTVIQHRPTAEQYTRLIEGYSEN